MIKIDSLTIRNFMSIGNVTQSVKFGDTDLVLVLGENLDLGGNDNRNGVGKSSIVNALSYALYGSALTNIRKDNLINATNMKNMLVTLTFEANGVSYRIERGRKPGIFRFIKNGVNSDDDSKDENDSQGENRHTQEEIERIIGVSHDMFKHILALNTYVEPFLSLRANDQRTIIEQLLGITKLSEKAENLSKEIRITKDNIKEEEFRINAAVEANKRIEANIRSLEIKSSAWEQSKVARIDKLQSSIISMLNMDINEEIAKHKQKQEAAELTGEYRSLNKDLLSINQDIERLTKMLEKADKNLSGTQEKLCPTCNQEMDKELHARVHQEFLQQCQELENQLADKLTKKAETQELINSLLSLIPAAPVTFYSTIEEAYNHKTALDTLGNNLSSELESINPFVEQIESLKEHGLQPVDFAKLNELTSLKDHQEFLLKLLTSRDSFIRKKIIDQNLGFLNSRLAHYLTDSGLPHLVKFKSDLEVEISLYGKEFDFDNLSRGERTRLILSLSWAFRDVFEGMNGKINLLFIDELIDSGLDSSGVESALSILKKMSRENKRTVFLISHRDELIGRVSNVLKVTKESGFTTLELVDTNE